MITLVIFFRQHDAQGVHLNVDYALCKVCGYCPLGRVQYASHFLIYILVVGASYDTFSVIFILEGGISYATFSLVLMSVAFLSVVGIKIDNIGIS